MRDFAGKVAVVTGAASGIGLGLSRVFARAGARVAMADIDEVALEAAVAEVAAIGPKVLALPLDVSDRSAMEEAAEIVRSRLGQVRLLFNNAGVSVGPVPIADHTQAQWDWIFGVNVFGVTNGIAAFLPEMLASGEDGHVVNTASIGGLQVNPALRNSSYSMTKYAVVALSEALALELEATRVGVSVLCPAAVKTGIYESGARRPQRFGGPTPTSEIQLARSRALQEEGLEPDEVGARVLRAVEENEFYIFTHAAPREWIERRHARLLAGFDALDDYLSTNSGP